MLFWRGKLSKLGFVLVYALFFCVIFVLKKSSVTQNRSNPQQETQFQPSNNMVLQIDKEFENVRFISFISI